MVDLGHGDDRRCTTADLPPDAAGADGGRGACRTSECLQRHERRGLANDVAKQLRKRGFLIGKVENDPAKRKVTGIAEVRASTAGAAAARTVGAQVASFVSVPDQRKDASVDLVLGAGFRTLRTTAAATAAMTPTPSPRPSGC